MDSKSMDEAMIHADAKVRKRFSKFLIKFYGSRMPSLEEASQLFNVPPELIMSGMASLFGEEMIDDGNRDPEQRNQSAGY